MSLVISSLNETIASKSSKKKKVKVDWSNSPLLTIKNMKNSVGDFGETLYKNVIGVSATVVKKEHDVYVEGGVKVEVKTAFQDHQSGNFWFNQIKEHKDWNKIVFVFVKPREVEIWECDRDKLNFSVDFFANNHWSWKKNSSSKLSSAWTKIYNEVF